MPHAFRAACTFGSLNRPAPGPPLGTPPGTPEGIPLGVPDGTPLGNPDGRPLGPGSATPAADRQLWTFCSWAGSSPAPGPAPGEPAAGAAVLAVVGAGSVVPLELLPHAASRATAHTAVTVRSEAAGNLDMSNTVGPPETDGARSRAAG